MDNINGAIEKLQHMMSSEEGQGQLQDLINSITGSMSGTNTGNDSGFDLSSLAGMFGNSEEHNKQSSNPDNGANEDTGFNADMLFKLQQMMQAANVAGNSKHQDFLLALKPYLSEKRRDKLDMAIKMLGMAKIASMMKTMG